VKCVDSYPFEQSGPLLKPPSSLKYTKYDFTSAKILIDYEFELLSLFCSTEDVKYDVSFIENDVPSDKNDLITIDTASKNLTVYSETN
jgi:hypothetical protein